MFRHSKYFFAFIFLAFNLCAQDTSKIKIIPGKEYEAGTLHRIFFGELWRDTWTTPADVDILDLNSFAGGLTPVKRGGGFQTKTLRFKGKDGKEYKFRSLNKDPVKLLPPELQETFAADILKDQISTSNPYAPLVAAPIINAMGILQAEPSMVFLPDDAKLGEFREEFAEMPGTIEEHPEEGFGGAVKVINTFKLFDEMEKDHNNQYDAAAYLKVRLIDIYLGDWDRHTDQWRWGRYDENGKHIWRPIPRDRDQAFSKFDGLFPWITAMAITQLEGFSGTYPDIEDLTWSGRFIDRRILSRLTKAEWDSVTSFITDRLTDSLIISAVRRLPQSVFALEGDKFIFTLMQRRNRLNEASEIYYRNIIKYTEVRGSNKPEYAEIVRENDTTVSVNIYKYSEQNKGELLFVRNFYCGETKEIRIFLLGGDDYAVVRGKVNSSIDLIINGGKGNNLLADSSEVKGYFLGFVPFISKAEKKTYLYAVNDKTKIMTGPSSRAERIEEPDINDPFEKYEPKLHDYGHNWRISPSFDISSELGIYIGGGPVLYEYGYRNNPYVYRMELSGGYAHKGDKFKFFYGGDFYSLFNDIMVRVEAHASGLEVLSYYGSGNETKMEPDLWRADYYRVEQNQFIFKPSFVFNPHGTTQLDIGMEFTYSDTDLKNNSFLNYYRPYGIDNHSLLGLTAGITAVTMDHPLVPGEGYRVRLSFSYFPEIWNHNSHFGNVRYDLRYYYPFPIISSVIAFKSSGMKIWVNYPFFKSAFLGGLYDLKGFYRERFSGDAAVSFNTELRTYLLPLFILFPVRMGTVLSAETGRVFVNGERSKLWHSSYGGGFWFSVINNDITISLTAAKSVEDLTFNLLFGIGI